MNIGIVSAIGYCLWRGWSLNHVVKSESPLFWIIFEILVTFGMIWLLLLKSHIFPLIIGAHLFFSLLTGFLVLILPVPELSNKGTLTNTVHDSWIKVGINSLISLCTWSVYFYYGG